MFLYVSCMISFHPLRVTESSDFQFFLHNKLLHIHPKRVQLTRVLRSRTRPRIFWMNFYDILKIQLFLIKILIIWTEKIWMAFGISSDDTARWYNDVIRVICDLHGMWDGGNMEFCRKMSSNRDIFSEFSTFFLLSVKFYIMIKKYSFSWYKNHFFTLGFFIYSESTQTEDLRE